MEMGCLGWIFRVIVQTIVFKLAGELVNRITKRR